jgi:hypothetical protein
MATDCNSPAPTKVTEADDFASSLATSSNAKTVKETRTERHNDDGFAAANQAIMRLPLTDGEQAEAVRRLLET